MATISHFTSKVLPGVLDYLPVNQVPDNHAYCFYMAKVQPENDGSLQKHNPRAFYLAVQENEEMIASKSKNIPMTDIGEKDSAESYTLHLRRFCDIFNSSTLKCFPDPSRKTAWTNNFLGMMINLVLLPYLLFPISEQEREKYNPGILEDYDEKIAMVFLLLTKSINKEVISFI